MNLDRKIGDRKFQDFCLFHLSVPNLSVLIIMKTIFFLTALCLASPLPAADGPNFADDVLPILRKHCVNCHRPGKTRAGLDLTTVETIEKGGSSGASVQPGGHCEATLYDLATGDGNALLVDVAQKTSRQMDRPRARRPHLRPLNMKHTLRLLTVPACFADDAQ